MATATESRIGIAVASISRGGGSNVLSMPKYNLGLNRSSVINSGDRVTGSSFKEILSQPAIWPASSNGSQGGQRPADSSRLGPEVLGLPRYEASLPHATDQFTRTLPITDTIIRPLAAIAAEVQSPQIRKSGSFANVSRRNQVLARESKNWVTDAAQKGLVDSQVAQSAIIIEQVKSSARRGLVIALGDLSRAVEVKPLQPEIIVPRPVQKVAIRRQPVVIEGKFRIIDPSPAKPAQAAEKVQAQQIIEKLQRAKPAQVKDLWTTLGVSVETEEQKKKKEAELQASAQATPGLVQIVREQLVKEVVARVPVATEPNNVQQVAAVRQVATEQLNKGVVQANPALSPQEAVLLRKQAIKRAQAAVAPVETINPKTYPQTRSSNGGVNLRIRKAASSEEGPKYIVEDEQALVRRARHLERGLTELSFRSPNDPTDGDLYADGNVLKWWLYLAAQQDELMHSQIVREDKGDGRFGKVKDGSLARFINSAGKLGILPILKMWRKLTQANLLQRPGKWSGKDKHLLSEGEITTIVRQGEVDQGGVDLWVALKNGLQVTALEVYDQRLAKKAQASLG